MAFTQIFALVILAFAVDALDWKNCDEISPGKFTEITLSPDPVKLRKGERVRFGGKFTVTGEAGTEYKLHIKLQKKVWFTWVTIPCRSNFGSCTYDIGCNQMKDVLEGAQCPLENGQYIVKERTVTLPDVSIPSWIKNGKYFLRVDLSETGNKRRIACLEATLGVRS
ncbi:ML domain [Desmophyllum pertusum]|uniref:ML domain n=1 Tax=Desmophyllum pertusum TaxID=174260 RepID=A0A9W9YT72_9CNID|nr:ML domain [Desmophyllum pertusum]